MVPAEPIPGELGRYQVQSATKAEETYLVDLMSHTPLGECSCRDYQCRSLPEFRKTGKVRHCKHIKEARTRFIDDIIEHLLEKDLQS